MAGLPKHVPFLKAPVSLRVGQAVHFRVVSRGDDLQAIDISLVCDVHRHLEREMPKAIADTSDLNTSSTLRTSVVKLEPLDSEDVMSSVPGQSYSRCFLRRMSQFRNSGQAEQVQLVIEAERSLDKLLGQSTLDGDAICRLARKCASWLRPPVLQTANLHRQFDHKSAGGTEDHVHLQERVRKIIIHALNHLDLQDSSTFEAMKTALFYMASLCQRLDEKPDFSSKIPATTPARTQWLELKSLLADSGLKTLVSNEMSYQAPSPAVEDQSKSRPGPLPNTANIQEQMKGEAGAIRIESVEGEHEPKFRGRIAEYYEPTQKIKAMSTVSQDTPVKLMCSECPFTIASSWYFQHPKNLKRWVIVPRGGHLPCRQKVKNCFWKNPDGMPVVRCLVNALEYCPHNKALRDCASCGGSLLCIHARRRYACEECRHLFVRRPRSKRCRKAFSGGL